MHLTLVGLSHKTAPVEIREKLTFPANRQENALSLLCCGDAVNEAVIVSTCNRTEVYAVTSEGVDGASAIIDFMCDYHDLDRHDLVPYLYLSEGEAVVRHLFRVVASLDSMVLGEAQILGQVKEAYEASFDAGASQRIFNKLFRQSFEVGKRVRNETAIGEAAVSISYAAVELAKKVFEQLTIASVNVPSNQAQMLYTLNWPGSELEAILVDPYGEQVGEDYPGASFHKTASLSSVIIKGPRPGNWQVQAKGVDVPEATITDPSSDLNMPSLIYTGLVADVPWLVWKVRDGLIDWLLSGRDMT